MIEDGLLYKKIKNTKKIVIPNHFNYEFVALNHLKLGHIGINALTSIINAKFHIKGLKQLVIDVVGRCTTCQVVNFPNFRKTPITVPDIQLQPLDEISMDHFQMERQNGFSHVLILIDTFSNFIWLYPCRTESSNEVVNHLENFCSIYGPPRTLKSDNSTSLLKNKNVKQMCHKWGIYRTTLSLPYSPHHNSRVERRIRDVRGIIRKYRHINTTEKWPSLLKTINLVLNSTQKLHRMDRQNLLLSPYYKFFFRESPLNNYDVNQQFQPISKLEQENLQKFINDYMTKTKKAYAELQNMKAKDKDLKVGDFVLYINKVPPIAG